MEHTDNSENFVRHLTEHQNRIYGYVFSLVGDHSRAADVVQETNLVLWRKIGEFKPGKQFLPWAFAIARFQVLAHLRDHKRDRLLLDTNLTETLSTEAESHAEQIDIVREALRPCLKLLTRTNRELVEHRYFQAMSVDDVAESVDRTPGAVKVALLRIRRQLADCVQQRMTAEV